MSDKDNELELELDADIEFDDEPAKIMGEAQISSYVHVSIDEDLDVTILDSFMGETKSILPKDEAIGVARFILEFFEEIPKAEE